MTENTKRVAYALGGLVAGALLLWGTFALLSDDEDRPPIIVKNGSLIFESGTAERGNARWTQRGTGSEYYQNHAAGRKVERFQVYFLGGAVEGSDDPCRSVTATDITVMFDAGAGNVKQYQVTRRSQDGKQVPVVSGPDLEYDNGKPYVLQVDSTGASKIAKVSTSSIDCVEPREVWVEMLKK